MSAWQLIVEEGPSLWRSVNTHMFGVVTQTKDAQASSTQRVLRWRNSFAKDTGCNTAPLHEFLETLPFLEGKTFQVAA